MYIYLAVYMRYRQFTTYTNICLIFCEIKKKRYKGVATHPRSQQVRAEINTQVYTRGNLTDNFADFLFGFTYHKA